MISLKRYLESQQTNSIAPQKRVEGDLLPAVVNASGSALMEMGNSSMEACPGTDANGYKSGTFQNFTINSDGTVSAKYSNGQNQTVGQIALANVTNLQGLQLLGDGDYATTLASGTASVGAAGTGGLATIEDDALEASNVNISSEFSDLIVARRAFEANAKSVTTFDTVTQDTINMVH